MPKYYELPDGNYVEAPDDMPDEEISQRIRQYQSKSQGVGNLLSKGTEKAYQFIAGAGDELSNAMRNTLNALTLDKLGIPQAVQHGEGGFYEAGKIGGDIGGAIAGAELFGGPALSKLGKLAGKSSTKIGKGLAALSKGEHLLPRLATTSLGMGAYSGLTSPENRGESAFLGAALGIPTELGVTAASKLMGALPGGLARSRQALAQARFGDKFKDILKRRLELAEGTETPLGNIVEDPTMVGQFENVALRNPMSSAGLSRARTGRQMEEKLSDVLTGWLKRDGSTIHPSDVPRTIENDIKDLNKKVYKEKIDLYKDVSDIGNKRNIKFSLPSTRDYFVNDLSKNKPLFSKLESSIKAYEVPGKLFEKLSNLFLHNEKEPLIKTYSGLRSEGVSPKSKGPVFENRDLDLVHLKVFSNELYNIGKSQATGAEKQPYFTLARKIRNDIRNNVKKSPEDYRKAVEIADKHYKEKFAPFLDPQIDQILRGKLAPSKIASTFIKTSKNTDEGELAEKLMKVLPEKTKDLFKFEILGNRLGLFKPGELPQTYESVPEGLNAAFNKSLGTNQKKAIFEPKELEKLKDLSDLISLNPGSLAKRELKAAQIKTTGAAKIPGAIASEGADTLASMLVDPGKGGKSILRDALISEFSRILGKAQTSPEYRKQYIESILKDVKKDKISPELAAYLGRILGTASLKQTQNY